MIDLVIGKDKVAEARFDAPGEKVNILNVASMARLAEVLDAIERGARDGAIAGAIFTSAKPGVFLAGADVKAFVAVAASGDVALAEAKAREGQALFSRIAALPVPTVAAINGACLGGGLELALACTARIAADAPEVSIGLPEVRLGLVPGWGGTQRLPRLIGPSRALDLILTGRALPGRKAKSFGVVDRVVPVEGLDRAARRFALDLAAGQRPRRPRWNLLDRTPLTRPLVYRAALRRALAQTRGRYPAPPAAVACVREGLTRPIEEGLALEARRLSELIVGDVSRNLVQIFLMSRAAGSGARRSAAPAGPPRLGVIGAGTMGGGIAAVAAMAGIGVRMKDVDAEALARGMKQVHEAARDARRRGRLSEAEATRREALVSATTDLSGFARCDLVVEAVVEDLEVKRAVLRDVEAATPPTTVFATNTSSLPVSGLIEVSSRPARVIGLHFFNPVQKMPLVEIVRGPATDPDAVALAVEIARRMGKTPVVVADTPGFVVNRILMPYLGGAVSMLRSGRDPVEVDESLVRFGMPMGPFALLDQIGLDVAAKVAGVLASAFGGNNGAGSVDLLHAMAAAGLKGVKAGKGFYAYTPSGEKKGPSPEVASLIPAPKASGNGNRPAPPADETADALVDLMINEAAALLECGAVDKPEVIDLAMVMGTGFPPFRGGLLRHADAIGRDVIASRLRARGVQPAPLLEQKGRFYPVASSVATQP